LYFYVKLIKRATENVIKLLYQQTYLYGWLSGMQGRMKLVR